MSDRLLKESDVLRIAFQLPLVVNSAFADAVKALPSAQPEVRPIDYQDCSNAMLKMWMDDVVTDGEYNRIMDKLNTHWGMEESKRKE